MDLDKEAMQKVANNNDNAQGYEEKGWLLRDNENVLESMVPL